MALALRRAIANAEDSSNYKGDIARAQAAMSTPVPITVSQAGGRGARMSALRDFVRTCAPNTTSSATLHYSHSLDSTPRR